MRTVPPKFTADGFVVEGELVLESMVTRRAAGCVEKPVSRPFSGTLTLHRVTFFCRQFLRHALSPICSVSSVQTESYNKNFGRPLGWLVIGFFLHCRLSHALSSVFCPKVLKDYFVYVVVLIIAFFC